MKKALKIFMCMAVFMAANFYARSQSGMPTSIQNQTGCTFYLEMACDPSNPCIPPPLASVPIPIAPSSFWAAIPMPPPYDYCRFRICGDPTNTDCNTCTDWMSVDQDVIDCPTDDVVAVAQLPSCGNCCPIYPPPPYYVQISRVSWPSGDIYYIQCLP